MIGLVVRIILVLIVIRLLWRLVAGVLEGLREPSDQARDERVALVRDPVCGTYVVPGRALALRDGALVRHFCSERCRDAFAREPRSAR